MEMTSFIFITLLFFYIVYVFFLDEDKDLLERRLMRFSQPKADFKPETESNKIDIRQAFAELLKPLIAGSLKKGKQKTLKQLLLEAGYPSEDEEVFKFMAYKIFFAVFGLILGLLIAVFSKLSIDVVLMLCLITPFTCYVMPDFRLKRIIKNRSDEITYNLPDALDLLTVCVEAGLGLDAALTKVSQEQTRTSPILAKELGRVSKDIQAGIFRQDAFRNLVNRNNVPDLKTFVALLIQTDKLGTSIGQSLRTYSDTIRTKRRQRVETLAQQASVKMVIPLILFILPVIMLVLLGPAFMNLIKGIKGAAF
ncbi:MAG: type II secretion system F family protein [Candidatus Gastranaerophilales bacterium]|nr:type II secretion system F family protein [Candidatus Gastranaerophilales bacterium]